MGPAIAEAGATTAPARASRLVAAIAAISRNARYCFLIAFLYLSSGTTGSGGRPWPPPGDALGTRGCLAHEVRISGPLFRVLGIRRAGRPCDLCGPIREPCLVRRWGVLVAVYAGALLVEMTGGTSDG
ncbi:hypothetical protein GCM10022252_11660 [Streptosporangium oxazolinicum]|uniref:Uncharacterized protein n=1 Tax=Streptosporangium oxazolinicum TaxID=909287 RepID=A0ABP8AHA3_9ACTN